MSAPYAVLPLADGLLEDVYQRRIIDVAAELRVRWHHETDSRRTRRGWPDLTLYGPGGVLFTELKRDGARHKVTEDQALVLAGLMAAGSRVAVWRPSCWPFVHTALHRVAGRPVPNVTGLADLTRWRIRRWSNARADPHGSLPPTLAGDFATRVDAETVRAALTEYGRTGRTEVVECDAVHGRALDTPAPTPTRTGGPST